MHKIDAHFLSTIINNAINSMSIGLFFCDENGDILYVNDGINVIRDKFCIDESINDFVGLNIALFSNELKDIFNDVKRKKSINNFEIKVKNQNEGFSWFLSDLLFIDIKEKISGVLISLRDITAYKNLEIKNRKTEKSLESIVNTVPDIIYRVDPQGNITYINDTIKKYGYSPEELIGSNILQLVHPDDIGKSEYRINERRTGDRKTRNFEVRLITKKNEVVTFEFDKNQPNDEYFLISSEGIYITTEDDEKFFIGTQGIVHDITSKKNIEKRYMEDREKLTSILDSLEDGYYEVDLKGNFIFANKSYSDTLGCSIGEIPGLNYKEYLIKEEIEGVTETFTQVYNTGVQAKILNMRIVRKDGKIRNVECSVSLMKDSDGNSTGFRGIIRDVTDKIKLEQELLRARKLEAIGILAGGIAHDYNNALTAIMGNISLAKMEIENNQGLLDILDDAEKASFKIMDLTKRLSNFSKGGRPVKNIVQFTEFIHEVVDNVLFKYKGSYTLMIPDNLWEVEVDEIQISHALENILNNSMEAAPKGTIEINAENMKVEKEESHHEISLQPGEYVVIAIKDNGYGIDNEIGEKVFDPYFTTKEFASGMGLATTYAIIKRHRGYIDFESMADKGTTFYMYLPVQK